METQNQNQVQNQAIAHLLPATTQNYHAIESQPSTIPIDMPTTIPAIANNPTIQIILAYAVLIRACTVLVQSCTLWTRTILDRPKK